MGSPYEIFISYKHGRSEISNWRNQVSGESLAADLKSRLIAQAIQDSLAKPRIFLDIHEIPGNGSSPAWQEPAHKAVRDCTVFVRIAGRAFFASRPCRLEEKFFIDSALQWKREDLKKGARRRDLRIATILVGDLNDILKAARTSVPSDYPESLGVLGENMSAAMSGSAGPHHIHSMLVRDAVLDSAAKMIISSMSW